MIVKLVSIIIGFLLICVSARPSVETASSPSVDNTYNYELPLKKIIMAENETTAILEWKNGQVIEIILDKIDRNYDDCIYSSEIREDEGSSVLITGCFGEEEITIQVQSEIFGDFLATAAIDGTIKSPPRWKGSLKNDTILSFDDYEVSHARTKREYLIDLDFYEKHDNIPPGMRNLKLPSVLEADMDIYISPSWRSRFGTNYKKLIIRIIKQVALLYKSRTLKTKIDFKQVKFTEVGFDLLPSRKNLTTFMNKYLSKKANLRRSMHLLLTSDGKDYGELGIANSLSMCDRNPFKAASLTKYFYDNANTAYVIAHELGHLIGMFHDFEKPYYFPQIRAKGIEDIRKYTCGAGELEGGDDNYLMNYEIPMQPKWAKCSNEDFSNYYKLIVGNDEEFCLKSPQT